MPSFSALAKRQGELIRKPLAGIIGVADEDLVLDADFKLTTLAAGGAVELTALDDWDQLGWVSKSDGVVFSADTETSDVESWGALEPTRSDITKDVTGASANYEAGAPYSVAVLPEVLEEDLEEIARMINKAKQPMVYCGGGVAASDGGPALKALLDKSEMPSCFTIMAQGKVIKFFH